MTTSTVLPPINKYDTADHNMAERLIVSDDYAMQEKVDGARLTVVITSDGIFGYNKLRKQVALASWLRRELELLPSEPWIFDGEFTGNGYHIFDLLESPKASIADKPFSERMGLLNVLVTHWREGSPKNETIRVVDTWLSPKNKLKGLLKLSISQSEGAVFRPQNTNARFRGQIYKYKFRNTVDAVVMNNTEGVGSVEVGVYQDNDLVPIGKCSTNKQIPVGTVVEISYRKISSKEHRMIEPVFVRRRTDKLEYQCTWNQLDEGKHLQDRVLIDQQAASIAASLNISADELHEFITTLGENECPI